MAANLSIQPKDKKLSNLGWCLNLLSFTKFITIFEIIFLPTLIGSSLLFTIASRVSLYLLAPGLLGFILSGFITFQVFKNLSIQSS